MKLCVVSAEGTGVANREHCAALSPAERCTATLVMFNRPGSDLAVPPGMGAFLALRGGSARYQTVDGEFRLEAGSFRSFCPEERPVIGVADQASGVLLTGMPAFWCFGLARESGFYGLPLPMQSSCGSSTFNLLKQAEQLSHACGSDVLCWVEAFNVHLLEVQRPYLDLGEVCAGRSLSRRMLLLKRLLRARLYIENAGLEDASLRSLSEIVGYSVPHFVRSFHRVFGVPPYEFAQLQRMQHAAQLIGESKLSITEIAQAVGVGSHSVLARQLRSHYGCSATELRRRMSHRDEDSINNGQLCEP